IVDCEWAAGNVGVCGGVLEQAAGASHGAAFRGNATDAGEATEHGPFAGGQPSAEPAHRKAENRLHAIEFANHFAVSATVAARRGPGVVFVNIDALVTPAVDLKLLRRIEPTARRPHRRAG